MGGRPREQQIQAGGDRGWPSGSAGLHLPQQVARVELRHVAVGSLAWHPGRDYPDGSVALGLPLAEVRAPGDEPREQDMTGSRRLQSLKGLQESPSCSFSAAECSPFTSCSGW